jgi:hypothetical protein
VERSVGECGVAVLSACWRLERIIQLGASGAFAVNSTAQVHRLCAGTSKKGGRARSVRSRVRARKSRQDVGKLFRHIISVAWTRNHERAHRQRFRTWLYSLAGTISAVLGLATDMAIASQR